MVRAVIAMSNPALAKTSAVALPIPRLAPVMSATLFDMLCSIREIEKIDTVSIIGAEEVQWVVGK